MYFLELESSTLSQSNLWVYRRVQPRRWFAREYSVGVILVNKILPDHPCDSRWLVKIKIYCIYGHNQLLVVSNCTVMNFKNS